VAHFKDIKECDLKRTLEIIEAAIHDYKRGVLSDVSAIVAIKTLFTDHTPSPEAIKWAEAQLQGGKWPIS